MQDGWLGCILAVPADQGPTLGTGCPYVACYPSCSLDTGRLNPETYQLFDKVEKHYNIKIEYTFPEAQVHGRG
jgi:hypothetical protein